MPTASQQYLKHLNDIMQEGSLEQARGLIFSEIMGMTYTVPMKNPIPVVPSRGLGYRFAAAEPYWILSGKNLLADIAPYGKMAPYSDDGYFMSGAYGPKIVDQLGYVCKTLTEDLGSRQAVINIWRERPGPSKDIPCTLSLQFLVRDGKLHCMASMRSSDAFMGLPYDSILFSLCSAYVLSLLEHHYMPHTLGLGELTVFLGSAHIYDKDFAKVTRIVEEWDWREYPEIDFMKLADQSPANFLDLLESFAMDEDGVGILEVGGL